VEWLRWAFRAKSSLAVRLLALSLAALAPGFGVIAYTEYAVNKSRQAEVDQLALRSAKLASSEIDRIILGLKALLFAVSSVPDVREQRNPGCTTYLVSLLSKMTNLGSLSVSDTEGNLRCRFPSEPSDASTNVERAFFLSALTNSDLTIGEYTIDRHSNRPILPVGLAVHDDAAQAVGAIVATIDLNWLGEQMKERGLPPQGSITVADRSGVIIARQPFPERFVGTRIPDPFMRFVYAQEAGAETVVSQDGVRRVLGYSPINEPPKGIYVSAGLSVEASYQAVARSARIGGLIAFCTAIATLAGTWFIGQRAFVLPILNITRVLKLWRSGNRNVRTGRQDRAGEIGELQATLDAMIDEIIEGQRHRELLANELAHRVKNSLTTVQAIAHATLNKDCPASEVLPDFLSRIAALAATHEVLTRDHWESANLADLVRRVVEPLCGEVEGRFRLSGPAVVLPPRDALAITMVIHELCTNALKYGALSGAGQIDVTWSLATTAEGLLLNLVWQECDGPGVVATARNGFGTRLIERALGGTGSAQLNFRPEGVSCTMRLLLPIEKATR
jgi:two-component sensor histidine kinase